ncbi:MAG: M13 family peptidase, partial [Candidatus Eremiobacteraeota bacterium]|nr:M13 family peptidase [Candidatus Eremiobacteraeota bacterium]
MRGSSFALRGLGAVALGALVWTSTGAATNHGFDLTNLDRSCPACRDFYQFADGGWVAAHPVPPDQSRIGAFDQLHDRNEEISRSILEAASTDPRASGDRKKIGDLYASCMDEASVEKAALTPLDPLFAKVASASDVPSVVAATAALQTAGVPVLWNATSTVNVKNATQQIALLAPSGLTLPDRDFYTRTDPKSVNLRDAYVAHVKDMFTLAGDDAARAEAESRTILAVETALAKEQLTAVERRNPDNTFHLTARDELAKLAPHVSWDRYFATREFPAFSELNVSQPAYVKALDGLLASTPFDDVKTYLRWRVLTTRAPWLAKRFADADFAFNSRLTGTKEQLPRWKRCVRLVDVNMGLALGREWVAKAFPPEAKARADAMVLNLIATLHDDIEPLPWMSAA